MADQDLLASLTTLGKAGGTRKNKQLPAAKLAPVIPARVGSAGHVAAATSTSGGVDMTLVGAKTVTSTDGLVTFTFPDAAEAIVGAVTITIPAILRTP